MALVLKNDKTIEIIEGCTDKELKFTKSNGKDGLINLSKKYIYELPYGEFPTSVYLCHEDSFYPIPNDPVVTAEDVSTMINKIFTDYMKYLTRLEQEKSFKPINIAIAIAILIGAVALFAILAPEAFNKLFGWGAKQAVQQGANAILNLTNQTIQNNTPQVIIT